MASSGIRATGRSRFPGRDPPVRARTSDERAAPTMIGPQRELDRRNETFWNELCGSGLARALGITDASRESLARFDAAYLALYPYLSRYLVAAAPEGRRVLEIGLGYGT